MKHFFAMLAAVITLAVALPAVAYVGDWAVSDNPGDREYMVLGDRTDGTGLYLSGTARWCGTPGDRYAKMRSVLLRNSGLQIEWWITNTCSDGYVRVCVSNWRNETACSTYINNGWDDFYFDY